MGRHFNFAAVEKQQFIDTSGKMMKTTPYQKQGKCGHFMPQFDSHGSCFGCRIKCKGQDPSVQGADVTECASCSALYEKQWTHLRESYAKRYACKSFTGS